ncbi:hypothetical protein N657DRAFT_649449 [Parathielavia appendiculata]|uniref:Ecp2 effector protein-like domain-containing protein n=1 Tax=Parathielavia appendiculata TaxID=2587402 RepID=A0AAN6TSX9_9PEZI|nr:hypothetical protein N657DRAFT_649449 [Parathielavia appendiculata]
MPSLTKLVLALAVLTTTTTLAAPASLTTTTTTTTPHQPRLSKRLEYQPSSGAEDDYCGEANPQYTYGPSAPLASDCKAMYEAHPGPGYWLISASETDNNNWARLAASGSCAFEVRLGSDNRGGKVDFRFGTNDVRFYTRSHAGASQARDGRVSVESPVWCSRKPADGMVAVDWRVAHS